MPAARPVALAEHFPYPYTEGLLPRYRANLAAAIVGSRKVIVRGGRLEQYALDDDPGEQAPVGGGIEDFAAACRRNGAPREAVEIATAHVRRWLASGGTVR